LTSLTAACTRICVRAESSVRSPGVRQDGYGLAAPPAGYTYVRPDPQDDTYYMIELASGLIASILGH
jgi:Ni/Co efflux regulator RcnB